MAQVIPLISRFYKKQKPPALPSWGFFCEKIYIKIKKMEKNGKK